MDQWNLAFEAPRLKAKQTMLSKGLTRVFDLLSRMKEELALIQESWEGEAGKIYCDSFRRELGEGYECARRLGEAIEALTRAEEEFIRCEAQVSSRLGRRE